MTVVGPPKAATERFLGTLEDARRVTGLRVHTVALAVVDADDAVGWARLTELGTSATMDGQRAAVGAVSDLMGDTLERAGALAGPVQVPTQVGAWGNGTPIRGTFAQTETVVRNRVVGGATFAEARAASADYLTRVAASEPHRVGRDGQLDAGANDPRFGKVRRVAESGACPWCRMLATRGAVYHSQETAGRFKKYHPLCRCWVESLVDTGAISGSKALAPDWRNAIRNEERLKRTGSLIEPFRPSLPKLRAPKPPPTPEPLPPRALEPPPPVEPPKPDFSEFFPEATPAPPPVVVNELAEAEAARVAKRNLREQVRLMKNQDLESEMKAAWDREDWDAADLLEAEVDARNNWAADVGRHFDDYDEIVAKELDDLAAEADLPPIDELDRIQMEAEARRPSRRAARKEWEEEQYLRSREAEAYGGGIRPDMRLEADRLGITLDRLMTGDPRTAYKYANQELLQWWETNGGRRPFYEVEARHGRYSDTKLFKARMTEDKARAVAQDILGKNRAEALAERAAKLRQERARSR